MWRVLADAMMVFHLAYLGYAAVGALLALKSLYWLVPHVGTAVWSVVVVSMQWRCPLTSLEKWLMVQGGETPYAGSFLDRYVFGAVIPAGWQVGIYALQLAFILASYAYVVHRHLARRRVAAGLAVR